jgi:hypothetical protein
MFIKEFQVSSSLILIILEVEVRLILYLSVNILSEAILLLSLNLFVKTERIKLLFKKSTNSFLDIFNMLVVIVVDGRDAREDTFFLLRAAQLREPLSFSGILLSFLAEVTL